MVGRTFDLFVGSHDGYSRLPNGVVHRRFVFSLKSGFWLVRDQAFGFGEYELDLFWHLGPGLREVADQENVFLATGHGVRFVTVEGHGWTREVAEWPHAPVYGKRESHSVLHFASKRRLPAEFVTVLSPVDDAPPSRPKLTKLGAFSSQPSAVVGYRYQTARDEHSMFFGEGKDWKLDPWSSDAEFLYCGRRAPASAPSLIAAKASYVRWAGRTIVTAKCLPAVRDNRRSRPMRSGFARQRNADRRKGRMEDAGREPVRNRRVILARESNPDLCAESAGSSIPIAGGT